MGPDGPLQRARRRRDRAACSTRSRTAEPEAVAVCLLHAYRHPEHERALGDALAERLPDVHVSLSHEVVGTFREFERAATTEVDAALSPLLRSYLRRLVERAGEAGLPEPAVMQSTGGLASAAHAGAHAALTVLSGPAGGAAGAAWAAAAAGEPDALCFDMGGTSCDVCVVLGGSVREAAGREVGGRPGRAADARHPHRRRRRRLDRLARPGRRAARRAALRGRPARPRLLRPRRHRADGHRRQPPARPAARRAPRSAATSRSTATPRTTAVTRARRQRSDLEPLECAEGILRVANAEMVRALRVMTVERGVDPRELALLCFGGAGGLHAAEIAEELGMTRILCPRASGVLAALGLVVSDRRRDVQRSVLLAGEELTDEALARETGELAERAREQLGDARRRRARDRRAALPRPGVRARRRGARAAEELREAFHAAHEEAYGYRDPEGEVELVTLRATATEPGPDVDAAAAGAAADGRRSLDAHRDLRRRGARDGRPDRRARARHGDRGPGAGRAARGDARRPARLGRRGARVRHDPAGEAP